VIELTNYINSAPFSWLGIYYRGTLTVHWLWAFAAGLMLTALIAFVIARIGAARRAALAGGPYRAQMNALQATNQALKEGIASEREVLRRQLAEASGNLPALFGTINAALGPSYPAKSPIAAIEAVREFQEWGQRVTAELKSAAPAYWVSPKDNFFADAGNRDALRAFLLRQSRASKDGGEVALAAREDTIRSLENALTARDQTINKLRDEVTRLGSTVAEQAVRISQLESEVPALSRENLSTVARMSKARD
jgi:hypothetical protein